MSLELTARKKESTGKGAARTDRRDKRVPAVLYGPKTESISLTVSAHQLEKLLRDTGGESRLLNLHIEDGGDAARQVLIREVQVHPYRRRLLHVDFYEVPLDQAIVVEVPVELYGDSIGVSKGGELNLIERTLSVRCLPNQIPEKIRIDIRKLDLGQTLHVEDLQAQETYQFVDDKGMGVVSVIAPEAAEQPAEAAAAAAPPAEAVKKEGAKKK